VLRNEELHDLYSSPNNERVIISNGVMWARPEVLWAERETGSRSLVGNVRERERCFEELSLGGKTDFKRSSMKGRGLD
jgi:hypothetical protein